MRTLTWQCDQFIELEIQYDLEKVLEGPYIKKPIEYVGRVQAVKVWVLGVLDTVDAQDVTVSLSTGTYHHYMNKAQEHLDSQPLELDEDDVA